ncbi:MAG TPA: DNA adenine methylase [Phycisphaerae bacterium]|nr:DNA adenine methylase [Phycisphaerae bacterium]HRY69645.1 DNA adenine methylase [Phycisphaerae bacterium]HSA27240.1 DNA adenine methylase [Phycisphaerae bacterium]
MSTAPEPRALIHRVGGKKRLARLILKHLPAHLAFTEAFAGSAAITLAKDPAPQGDIINDADVNIINLFRIVRDQPNELAMRIARTLYSRREFEEAYEYIRQGAAPDDDPIEWARRFLVVNRQGFYGTPPLTWSMSRQSKTRSVSWEAMPEVVMAVSSRLKTVTIECGNYADCLQLHDGPQYCHFIDPPYLDVETKYYDVNRQGGFNHRELRDVIEQVKGSVAVTYYERPAIRELYKGFRVVRIPVTTAINRKKKETELLLIRESAYAKSCGRRTLDIFKSSMTNDML